MCNSVKWMLAGALGTLLAGCSVARPPRVMIEPTYSYVRAEPDLTVTDIWPVGPGQLAQTDGPAFPGETPDAGGMSLLQLRPTLRHWLADQIIAARAAGPRRAN